MYNRQPVGKGCFTIIFAIIFGVPIVIFALIFVIYLFSKNILLGIIFCVAFLLLAEAWKKRQKAKEEVLKQMMQNMSKMAEATAIENRKEARLIRQKEHQAEKERVLRKKEQ